MRKPRNNRALLFSKISHELKSPIHGINGLAQYLYDNWDNLSDNARKSYMYDISAASRTLDDLMGSLLGFFRFDSKAIEFNFESADLLAEAKAAKDRAKIFLPTKKKYLSIDISCDSAKPVAKIDRFWFKQLLNNLLSNAINYSNFGSIVLNIAHDGEKKEYVISVKDSGVGIKDSELESIFYAFNQGSDANFKHGFGLGLTICKEIAQAHGGRIWANNNTDCGATISFSIPT